MAKENLKSAHGAEVVPGALAGAHGSSAEALEIAAAKALLAIDPRADCHDARAMIAEVERLEALLVIAKAAIVAMVRIPEGQEIGGYRDHQR